VDRGVPTEALLKEVRTSRQETFYLVGTSRAKVQQYAKKWLELPWQKVRASVEVKLFAQDGELYVLAKSQGARPRRLRCGARNSHGCYGSGARCGAVARSGISY
jgi:hypothetical protein